jgi:hypothetical protein
MAVTSNADDSPFNQTDTRPSAGTAERVGKWRKMHYTDYTDSDHAKVPLSSSFLPDFASHMLCP